MSVATSNWLPFRLPSFQIDHVVEHEAKLIVKAHSITRSGNCPDCGEASSSVHSYYIRSPRDLPCSSHALGLHLRVKRFRCQNSRCPRVTFVERLHDLVALHAQRTGRLTETLRAIALALGGEAGARVLPHGHIQSSADTLLRIMRCTPLKEVRQVRILGVDDWAFRKGHLYGTILVDLEQHGPIDLLPDREAETLANWLKCHPGVEIISRDRAAAYAEGARRGAPDAIQVADRWHLLKNLWDALAASYAAHDRLLRQITIPAKSPKTSLTGDPKVPIEVSNTDAAASEGTEEPIQRQISPKQQLREQRRAYWVMKHQEVRTLREQGLSWRAIQRETGLSKRTVRKYARLPELPRQTSPKSGPRLIDPYRSYLRERLKADNISSRQLWNEIRQQGFPGGHSTVYHCVAQLRQELGLTPPRRASTAQVKLPTLTPRMLAAWVLRPPDKLADAHQNILFKAAQLHPDIERAIHLGHDFAAMLRQGEADQLDPWLQAVTASELSHLKGFVSGIERDYDAVRAAFTLPWSNGQVEGQINRLKFIKRQMYGRAQFDLLRLRVLHPP